MAEKSNLGKLRDLLGIKEEDTTKDLELKFSLENAKEIVKNYCHIDKIPRGLSTTVVRMAMDIYRNEQPGESENPQVVKSITVGDTSTSFGSGFTEGYKDSLVKNYKSQLRRYRKGLFQ